MRSDVRIKLDFSSVRPSLTLVFSKSLLYFETAI